MPAGEPIDARFEQRDIRPIVDLCDPAGDLRTAPASARCTAAMPMALSFLNEM
jgi:hypothetical protein